MKRIIVTTKAPGPPDHIIASESPRVDPMENTLTVFHEEDGCISRYYWPNVATMVRDRLESLTVAVDQLLRENRQLRSTSTKQDNRPKLTDREKDRIREMYRNGYSSPQLAAVFDVHRSSITRVLKKEN